jgi:hypothetical protein
MVDFQPFASIRRRKASDIVSCTALSVSFGGAGVAAGGGGFGLLNITYKPLPLCTNAYELCSPFL